MKMVHVIVVALAGFLSAAGAAAQSSPAAATIFRELTLKGVRVTLGDSLPRQASTLGRGDDSLVHVPNASFAGADSIQIVLKEGRVAEIRLWYEGRGTLDDFVESYRPTLGEPMSRKAGEAVWSDPLTALNIRCGGPAGVSCVARLTDHPRPT